MRTGDVIRVLAETEIKQYIDYEWENPKIINFPSSDSSTILHGLLLLPRDYGKNKKYPLIVHGYGMHWYSNCLE